MAARQDLTVVIKTGKRPTCPDNGGVLLTCNPIIEADAKDKVASSVQIQNTSSDKLLDFGLELRLERIDCPMKSLVLSTFKKCPMKPGQSFEVIQDYQVCSGGIYKVAGTATYKVEKPGAAPLTYSVEI